MLQRQGVVKAVGNFYKVNLVKFADGAAQLGRVAGNLVEHQHGEQLRLHKVGEVFLITAGSITDTQLFVWSVASLLIVVLLEMDFF